MYDVKNWRHVFKLDPNKEISDEHLEKLCESGTDAIIVGGTDNVTLDNVLHLMARVRKYPLPCVLEVSNIESISPGFDLYLIPSVLNSRETKWITGLHHEAMKDFGELIDWNEIIVEGYCILNADCKVAKKTNANTDLKKEDVEAFAMMAENLFKMPIFYLEYSGTYGDINIVQSVKRHLSNTTFFYGGGIRNVEQAAEMSQYADVIVVGNVIYDDLKAALATVGAVLK